MGRQRYEWTFIHAARSETGDRLKLPRSAWEAANPALLGEEKKGKNRGGSFPGRWNGAEWLLKESYGGRFVDVERRGCEGKV